MIPVLLKKENDTYEPITVEEFDDAFQRAPLNARTFVGRDRTKYVFTDDQAESIQDIQDKYRKVSREKAEEIMRFPKETFDSDVFSFDLSLYGDRVEEIGAYEKRSLPYIQPESNNWLPPEGSTSAGLHEEPANTDFVTSENVEAIYYKISEAQSQGKNSIELAGKSIPISPELIEKVERVMKKTFDAAVGNQTSKSAADGKEKAVKQEIILKIKENLSSKKYISQLLEHKDLSSIGAQLQEVLLQGLRDSIQPMPHQIAGIAQMAKCWLEGHRGVLLADDMGLGKTMQAFGFISAIKALVDDTHEPMDSVLIVAPVSLLENWQEEYYKFVKEGLFEDIVPLYGNSLKQYKVAPSLVPLGNSLPAGNTTLLDLKSVTKNKIVLTTYETLRELQLSFGKAKWSIMILDEAQKIKNPVTKVSMAARAMNYGFGIALTGTPVENSWVDLWTIMDFVEPGKLSNLEEFNTEFLSPLKKGTNKKQEIEKLGQQLRNELDPLFIRRLKKDIADNLPKKEIKKFSDPMPPEQQKLYEEVAIRAANSDIQAGNSVKKPRILEVIAKLRDISLCPNLNAYSEKAIFKINEDKFMESSARLSRTRKILDEIQTKQEKVMIFIESRKMQLLISAFLERIYGKMEAATRQRIVNEFNRTKGFQILILSPLAAGVGLNIIGANHVIHLSRCWNPAKEDQATDRCYRIGQKKDVTVYIPMAIDKSFEEAASFDFTLDRLLEYKRSLSESALYPTESTPENAFEMFNHIEKAFGTPSQTVEYWSIDDLNKITGAYFEYVITALYNKMDGCHATKTRDSGDHGADVVVLGNKSSGQVNYLVQCKQTSGEKNLDSAGVREVSTAKAYYEKEYHTQFTCVVVTNARDFTMGTKAIRMIRSLVLRSLSDPMKL